MKLKDYDIKIQYYINGRCYTEMYFVSANSETYARLLAWDQYRKTINDTTLSMLENVEITVKRTYND